MRASVSILASVFLRTMCAGFAVSPAPPDGLAWARMQHRAGAGRFRDGHYRAMVGNCGHPITGQPYSVEQETEHSQTLTDGTHIVQKRETSRMVPGLASTNAHLEGARLTHICDPVAGYSYTLDVHRPIAHRFALPAAAEVAAADSSVAPARVTNTRLTPTQPAGRRAMKDQTDLRRQIKKEQLGTEMIDGVQADGTRLTTPVGLEGNGRPLTRVCEHWVSPELKITILSKCSDPRSGDMTARLRNLDRSEPDAAWFQVPPDYTIGDDKDRFTTGLNGR